MNLRSTTVLTLILSVVPSAASHGAELNSTIEVSSRTAEFSFPVARQQAWRWARAETADNALEYRWEIGIRSGGGEYQFGFSLFKYPGSKEETGSLGALLNAGQASLWKLQADGSGSLIKEAKVYATAGDGCVTIRVSDPASIHLLFGDRPSEAKALSRMPGSENTSCAVSIRYRD